MHVQLHSIGGLNDNADLYAMFLFIIFASDFVDLKSKYFITE